MADISSGTPGCTGGAGILSGATGGSGEAPSSLRRHPARERL